MKKASERKLVLHRETVKNLSEEELSQLRIAGATGIGVDHTGGLICAALTIY